MKVYKCVHVKKNGSMVSCIVYGDRFRSICVKYRINEVSVGKHGSPLMAFASLDQAKIFSENDESISILLCEAEPYIGNFVTDEKGFPFISTVGWSTPSEIISYWKLDKEKMKPSNSSWGLGDLRDAKQSPVGTVLCRSITPIEIVKGAIKK